MRRSLPSLTLIPALFVACARPASPTLPLALVPCAVPGVGSPDSPWRQVRASGFTFCVPGYWRPSGHARDSIDAKLWSGDRGSVRWDVGRPATLASGLVTTVTGQVVTDRSSRPCEQPMKKPLMVGGVALIVTQIECQGTWTTTAWSTAPAIYVQGVTHAAKVAELLQLSVMQTIRFTSPTR